MLVDGYGRHVRYLRLSITDRCNLRCFYCRSSTEFRFIPHENILSYEELFELVQAARSMNVAKLRLTGGEPFVRKGLLVFLEKLLTSFPGLDLRLTTNGTLLEDKIDDLLSLGVRRLNISLDTMDREKFRLVTGRDFYPQVRRAIDKCLEKGMHVKINAVALKGRNDMELGNFLDFARKHPIDVRFIEFMPIGDKTMWDKGLYWSADDILQQAQDLAVLTPAKYKETNSGPARIFDIQDGQGRFGVISAVSDHFCATCNRLRITSDGRLRTCLFSDKEYDLRSILRDPQHGHEDLVALIRQANAEKPLGHDLLTRKKDSSVCHRVMSSIGG